MEPAQPDSLPLALAAADVQTKKVKVLIVDGVNNHAWSIGTPLVREMLERTGRFGVDVSTSPPREAAPREWTLWKPQFDKHDVVLSNFNGGHLDDGLRWPAGVEEAFESYVSEGGGFVSLHAANNSFTKWRNYNEMIGLGWREPDFGPGLVIGEDEQPVIVPAGQGLSPGHGKAHDFMMTMIDPRHPITAGMPKRWMHPAEQLTHGQRYPRDAAGGPVDKALRVITYAWSKDSMNREPMDWVRPWGRGRIYVTMLGHNWRDDPAPVNYRCIGFRALLARGVEWAATGKVTVPVPENFPGGETPQLA